jgi:hypothetical protein
LLFCTVYEKSNREEINAGTLHKEKYYKIVSSPVLQEMNYASKYTKFSYTSQFEKNWLRCNNFTQERNSLRRILRSKRWNSVFCKQLLLARSRQ